MDNRYQPLNHDQAKLLVQITMAEMQGKGPVEVPESDYPFLLRQRDRGYNGGQEDTSCRGR